MSSASPDCDILIVGAGPVGLFLAHECARRGLRWRLVEMRDGQSVHSKALALFPRTLEIFDTAGLVDRFLDVANRVTWVAVVSARKQLTRIQFAPAGTPYPFIGMVPAGCDGTDPRGCAAASGRPDRVPDEVRLGVSER